MTPPDSRILFLAALLALYAAPALAARAPATKAATRAATKAVNVADPVAALIDQAKAAQTEGNHELAVRLGQSAIVADPARAAGYDALADVYAAGGEADFARGYYAEALEIDPADPAALKAVAALDHAKDQRAANTNAKTAGTP